MKEQKKMLISRALVHVLGTMNEKRCIIKTSCWCHLPVFRFSFFLIRLCVNLKLKCKCEMRKEYIEVVDDGKWKKKERDNHLRRQKRIKTIDKHWLGNCFFFFFFCSPLRYENRDPGIEIWKVVNILFFNGCDAFRNWIFNFMLSMHCVLYLILLSHLLILCYGHATPCHITKPRRLFILHKFAY